MRQKWMTYDEDFWETCPGVIIDMNGDAQEAAETQDGLSAGSNK